MTEGERDTEHFFRRESGRLVAALTRSLGPAHLDLAEQAVQEAFLQALRVWPMRGRPADPAAWLYRTARNSALDALRRVARFEARIDQIAETIRPPVSKAEAHFSGEIVDDQLRMMFLCCHPALSRASRVALTLKVAGGLSAAEIARAFRTSEPTIQQRLVRAKSKLQEVEAPFDLPPESEAPARLEAVLDALFLVFNEGYSPGDGPDGLRKELMQEAIRLGQLVAMHPAGREPHVYALLALMYFQFSRSDARFDASGALLPLEEQDRSRWDQAAIRAGFAALESAGRGSHLTEYHLLAGIAAMHAAANREEDTNWKGIVAQYDELLTRSNSDALRLNRAVAVVRAAGPAAGLAAVEELRDTMRDHYLWSAARADALDKLGRGADAAAAWREAAERTRTEAERRYFRRRAAAAV